MCGARTADKRVYQKAPGVDNYSRDAAARARTCAGLSLECVQRNAGGLGLTHPQEGLLSGRGALARQLTTLLLVMGGSVVILGTGNYINLTANKMP